MESHWIEIAVVVINAAALILNLTVNSKISGMRATMYEKFLTKEDFREWTHRSPGVQNFKG